MEVSADTVSAIIGAMGLATIVAAAINAISNRKKTGADATKTITDAALGVVTQLRTSLEGALLEVTEMKTREDERDRRDSERDHRDALRERSLRRHHEWDRKLTAVINEQLPDHANLLPPPPLWDDEDSPDEEPPPRNTRRRGL